MSVPCLHELCPPSMMAHLCELRCICACVVVCLFSMVCRCMIFHDESADCYNEHQLLCYISTSVLLSSFTGCHLIVGLGEETIEDAIEINGDFIEGIEADVEEIEIHQGDNSNVGSVLRGGKSREDAENSAFQLLATRF